MERSTAAATPWAAPVCGSPDAGARRRRSSTSPGSTTYLRTKVWTTGQLRAVDTGRADPDGPDDSTPDDASADITTDHASTDITTNHASTDITTNHASTDITTNHASTDITTNHASTDITTNHTSTPNHTRTDHTSNHTSTSGGIVRRDLRRQPDFGDSVVLEPMGDEPTLP